MNKLLKVAVVQRIIPHYRLPVFAKLTENKGLDVTILYGRAPNQGSMRNAENICEFKNKIFFTIQFLLKSKRADYHFVFHPFMIFHLLKMKYQVIILEGPTNVIDNLFIIPISKLLKTKIVWWDPGRPVNEPRSIVRKLLQPILSIETLSADSWIAYTLSAKKYLVSLGVMPGKIFVARNTIDVKKIQKEIEYYNYNKSELTYLRNDLGLSGKKIIIYSGALEKRRKVGNLLTSLERLQLKYNIALLIIGDGYYMNQLMELVKSNKIRDVHFLGRITQNIGKYFLLSDLLVLPGWSSLAINQAMAYARPVVTVPYGGPEFELVHNGENGFLVQENNIEELTKSIEKIINDPLLQKKMSENAHQFIIKEISLDNMVTNLIDAIYCII